MLIDACNLIHACLLRQVHRVEETFARGGVKLWQCTMTSTSFYTINLTIVSSLAFTNNGVTLPDRVVYITLLDSLC